MFLLINGPGLRPGEPLIQADNTAVLSACSIAPLSLRPRTVDNAIEHSSLSNTVFLLLNGPRSKTRTFDKAETQQFVHLFCCPLRIRPGPLIMQKHNQFLFYCSPRLIMQKHSSLSTSSFVPLR